MSKMKLTNKIKKKRRDISQNSVSGELVLLRDFFQATFANKRVLGTRVFCTLVLFIPNCSKLTECHKSAHYVYLYHTMFPTKS